MEELFVVEMLVGLFHVRTNAVVKPSVLPLLFDYVLNSDCFFQDLLLYLLILLLGISQLSLNGRNSGRACSFDKLLLLGRTPSLLMALLRRRLKGNQSLPLFGSSLFRAFLQRG